MRNEDFCMELKRAEDIYFAVVRGEIVGTGSIRGNEICRLFILPEYQAKGYGNRLMDFLEDMVRRSRQGAGIISVTIQWKRQQPERRVYEG